MSTWPRADRPVRIIILPESSCPERCEVLPVCQLGVAVAAGNPYEEDEIVYILGHDDFDGRAAL